MCVLKKRERERESEILNNSISMWVSEESSECVSETPTSLFFVIYLVCFVFCLFVSL